jgi:hypothetical protein
MPLDRNANSFLVHMQMWQKAPKLRARSKNLARVDWAAAAQV